MIVTVKYVENSQKNWDNIKNQKKKRLKRLRKKTCSKFTRVYYLQLYTLLYLLK